MDRVLGFSRGLGGLQCILARCAFELHLKEAFEKKRVDERHLPHLLTHYFLSYYNPPGPETVQLLLQNGCQVDDSFPARSAWEFLLWEMCRISEGGIDSELEVCRISLANGADPNLVIQPLIVDHFPLDLRFIMEKKAEKYKLPCYPLHMITASPVNSEDLLALLQTVKKFLEYGARLDLENAHGETILECASHWRLNDNRTAVGNWNFAPILLRLQEEHKIASMGEVDSVPGIGLQDTVLDFLDLRKDTRFDEVELKLKRLLVKLEEEGYGYVNKTRHVSPVSSRSSSSANSNDSTSTTALEESTSRLGSLLSDTGAGPSTG